MSKKFSSQKTFVSICVSWNLNSNQKMMKKRLNDLKNDAKKSF